MFSSPLIPNYLCPFSRCIKIAVKQYEQDKESHSVQLSTRPDEVRGSLFTQVNRDLKSCLMANGHGKYVFFSLISYFTFASSGLLLLGDWCAVWKKASRASGMYALWAFPPLPSGLHNTSYKQQNKNCPKCCSNPMGTWNIHWGRTLVTTVTFSLEPHTNDPHGITFVYNVTFSILNLEPLIIN